MSEAVSAGLVKKATGACGTSKGLVKSESASEKLNSAKNAGSRTREEHFRFLEALKFFGKEWKCV